MIKTQRIVVTIVTNIVLLFAAFIVLVSTIIDPACVQASTVVNGVIYAGDTDSKNISLMINVYWGTEYLDGILDALDKAKVKTTFFVGGSWVKDNPEKLKEIIARGHEIGSHGYSHKDHDKLSYDQNREEILKTHNLVKDITGLEMKLFAPPSGAYNKTTVEVASGLGYKTIMWTRDTIDWRDKDANIIYSRAIKDAKGGDLVLMHPTENTLKALPKVLEYLSKQNLKVTPVSEVIGSLAA